MNENYRVGDWVTYIPNHADNDITHPDCEQGVVKSVSDLYVFVWYHSGDTAAATKRENLVNQSKGG